MVVLVVRGVHAGNEQMVWEHTHAASHPSGQFCRWSVECSLAKKKEVSDIKVVNSMAEHERKTQQYDLRPGQERLLLSVDQPKQQTVLKRERTDGGKHTLKDIQAEAALHGYRRLLTRIGGVVKQSKHDEEMPHYDKELVWYIPENGWILLILHSLVFFSKMFFVKNGQCYLYCKNHYIKTSSWHMMMNDWVIRHTVGRVIGRLWLRGRAVVLQPEGRRARSQSSPSACRSVLGQETEPRRAPH